MDSADVMMLFSAARGVYYVTSVLLKHLVLSPILLLVMIRNVHGLSVVFILEVFFPKMNLKSRSP